MKKTKLLAVLMSGIFLFTSVLTACNTGGQSSGGEGGGGGEPVDPPDPGPGPVDPPGPEVVHVTDIVLSIAKTELDEGEETNYAVSIAPDNADDQTYTITSSDPAVAKIEDGKIKALKEGEATITATANDNAEIKDAVKVTVLDPLDSYVDPVEPVDPPEVVTDENLPKKEGETYEKYSYEPVVEAEKIPNIYVKLMNDDRTGLINVDSTKLVTGNRMDKGDYYQCEITMNKEDEDMGVNDKVCQIKVRGNYTSNYSKKPFRLKFDSKIALPGWTEKWKSWVLLADVKDHSMMRNMFSFYLGNKILGGDGYYSTNARPVNLYFIDSTGTRYWGSYLLCEQQEVKSGKVDITDVGDIKGTDGVKGNYNGTDIGYFIEYDGYYTEERPQGSRNGFFVGYDRGTVGDPTFTISYNNQARYRTINGGQVTPTQPGFTLKSDVSGDDNSAQLDFISKYMDNLYKVLYNGTYNNQAYVFNAENTSISLDSSITPEQAIKKVIDVQSLVDMYIISELSCDPDVAWSSFNMDVDFGADAKDHLLRFEAPWDFDSCYAVRSGNYCISGEGYYAATSSNPWLSVILNNEWFMNMVKAKYQELYAYDILKDAINFLDTTTQLQSYVDMYAQNFQRWSTRDETGEVRPEIARLQTEREHVQVLIDWLKVRMNWMSREWLDGFDIMTHTKTTGGASGEDTRTGNLALLEQGTKYRYEAEEADYSSPISPRIGTNVGASNNGYLGQVNGNSGSSITFTVTATRHKQCYLTMGVSQYSSDIYSNDMFDIYLNGEKLDLPNRLLPGIANMSWHDWYDVKLYSFFLDAGENEIKFVTKGNATNFDYIDIYSKDTLS